MFEDVFPFLKVEYVRFLEGIIEKTPSFTESNYHPQLVQQKIRSGRLPKLHPKSTTSDAESSHLFKMAVS